MPQESTKSTIFPSPPIIRKNHSSALPPARTRPPSSAHLGPARPRPSARPAQGSSPVEQVRNFPAALLAGLAARLATSLALALLCFQVRQLQPFEAVHFASLRRREVHRVSLLLPRRLAPQHLALLQLPALPFLGLRLQRVRFRWVVEVQRKVQDYLLVLAERGVVVEAEAELVFGVFVRRVRFVDVRGLLAVPQLGLSLYLFAIFIAHDCNYYRFYRFPTAHPILIINPRITPTQQLPLLSPIISFIRSQSLLIFYNRTMYLQYLQTLLQQHHIPFLSEPDFHQSQLANPAQQQQQQHPQQQPQQHPQQQPQVHPQQIQVQRPPLATNLQPPLTSQLAQRYSRQMLLSQISYEGQLKLLRSKVAIIGAGGVGCPLAMYLAAAGIGTLGLFDSDVVEITNLHRQVGHSTDRIGMEKTESLKRTLQSINPHITVNRHPFVKLQTVQALDHYDLVIDGSDNPGCRYMVNDYCMSKGKKVLSGACVGWEAQITVFGGESLCYRCLWGDGQVSAGGCSTLGVVGMVPGLVGLLLGIETIKLVVKGQSSLQGRLLTFDGRKCEFKRVALRKKAAGCIGCGANRLQMESYDYAKYNQCAKAVIPEVKEMSWGEYLAERPKDMILDVRPSNIYKIAHLANSTNIPYELLVTMTPQHITQLLGPDSLHRELPVSCVRGNTSRLAVKYLETLGISACSIKGGILAYRQLYDKDIPQL